MEDEVIKFIHRRFPIDNNWCTGNRYWFVEILHMRFPHFPIWLFLTENHFMVEDGEKFYDWKGIRLAFEYEEKPILWTK